MWLAGIDEAGRGCLCGSLFVAGVIGKAHIIKSFGARIVRNSHLSGVRFSMRRCVRREKGAI